MADIVQFRPRLTVFAPEQTSAMGDAYDKAIAALANTDSELMVRELVAKRIIRLARRVRSRASVRLGAFRFSQTADGRINSFVSSPSSLTKRKSPSSLLGLLVREPRFYSSQKVSLVQSRYLPGLVSVSAVASSTVAATATAARIRKPYRCPTFSKTNPLAPVLIAAAIAMTVPMKP